MSNVDNPYTDLDAANTRPCTPQDIQRAYAAMGGTRDLNVEETNE